MKYSAIIKVNKNTKKNLLVAFILLLAAAIRLQGLSHSGGMLTGDEIFDSHIQIYRILEGEPTYMGWSNYTHFTILHLWYSLAGFTLLNARVVSITMGVLSILFTYLFSREYFSERSSIIATLFLSFSLYHIHFSRLAMVNIDAVAFAMLSLYFLARFDKTKRYIFAISSSFAIGFGTYTYPGFLALLPPIFGVICFRVIYTTWHKKWTPKLLFKLLVLVFSGGIVHLLAFYLHYDILKIPQGILRGGGNLTLTEPQIISALKILYQDFFINAHSWYLSLHSNSFFEKPLVVIIVLGVFVAFFRYGKRALFSEKTLFGGLLFLSTVLLVAVSGAYPGARRAIILLPFISLWAALSIDIIFRSPWKKNALTATILILLVLNYYAVQKAGYWNFKQSINTHDDALYGLIDRQADGTEIAISKDEFGSQFGGVQYVSYAYLQNRYNGGGKSVRLLSEENFSIPSLSQEFGKEVYVVPQEKSLQFIAKTLAASDLKKEEVRVDNQRFILYRRN